MSASGKQLDHLKFLYRQTFDDYACKLDALQRLIDFESSDPERIERAILEVARARLSQNAARNRLVRELGAGDMPSGGGEHDVRETARFLWELAGRPDGTADRDWRQAEELVNTTSFTN